MNFFSDDDDSNLPLIGVIKKRGTSYGFLQFTNLDQKKSFEETFAFTITPRKPHYRLKDALNNAEAKNFRPVKSRQQMLQDASNRREQRHAVVTKEDVDEVLRESIEQKVTPFAQYPYSEQLQRKHSDLRQILDLFSSTLLSEISKNSEQAPMWFQMMAQGDYKIPLEPQIISVPEQIDKYRNKVEFTVGRTFKPSTDESRLWDEGDICVGFNRGNTFKGISFVEKPDSIKVNSDESLIVAKIFEEIVRNSQEGPYDKNSNSGFWRILVARESKVTKQMLLSVVITKGKEMSEDIKHNLIAKLGSGTKVGNQGFKIVSLTLIKSQDLSGGYKEQDELEILSGKDSYQEILCGLKFNVSPFAFFQVNTLVFEKMITEISEFAGIDQTTTLFDICCGTGAIGLCLSANAKKVIGVDIIEAAIANAKQNVALNVDKIDSKKIEFYAGRAEEVMPPIVLQESGQGKIVGIVDPPRSGLHRDVLKALRTCKGLDRLIYVSCNAHSQMQDMQYLCYESKKKRKGPPFKPIKAVGADLFPHTSHIESIVMLERSYN